MAAQRLTIQEYINSAKEVSIDLEQTNDTFKFAKEYYYEHIYREQVNKKSFSEYVKLQKESSKIPLNRIIAFLANRQLNIIAVNDLFECAAEYGIAVYEAIREDNYINQLHNASGYNHYIYKHMGNANMKEVEDLIDVEFVLSIDKMNEPKVESINPFIDYIEKKTPIENGKWDDLSELEWQREFDKKIALGKMETKLGSLLAFDKVRYEMEQSKNEENQQEFKNIWRSEYAQDDGVMYMVADELSGSVYEKVQVPNKDYLAMLEEAKKEEEDFRAEQERLREEDMYNNYCS